MLPATEKTMGETSPQTLCALLVQQWHESAGTLHNYIFQEAYMLHECCNCIKAWQRPLPVFYTNAHIYTEQETSF